jgi:energy-coupling factor transport system permease protein
MNPLLKSAWMFGTMILASLSLEPLPLLFLWAFHLAVAVTLAGLPWKEFLRVIAPFVPLGIGYVLVNLFFHQSGEVIWRWNIVTLSTGGIGVGLAIGLRVLTILTSAFLFSMTTDPRDMVLSLIQKLRVNYQIGFGLYSALRFMPLARDEFDMLRAAHIVRGLGRRPGPIGLLREYSTYAIPLLAIMIRKAIRTAIAMESKAFGAYSRRTYLDTISIPRRDVILLLMLLATECLLMYSLQIAAYLIPHRL